ncbi:MAG: hypothetical protein IPO30_20960 [Hyphomonadaceae bacterium]|nr:hypothetical protein [Hyphomonadaceae bacterium]
MHVAYLARDGRQTSPERPEAMGVQPKPELDRSVSYLSREADSAGAGLSFYNQRESDLDGKALTSAWVNDTRHFRLIISAEDGPALGDLRPFIREVMTGLEAKTGTQLEWIAVDHHDTDNPHTHILVRGRRSDGRDLFIPPKLIGSGIREHAQEIVTREGDLNARLKVMATHAEVEKVVSASRLGKDAGTIREAEHTKLSTGELVHFGPLDDLGETFLAIVENEHGELRYATLERADDLARLDGVQVGANVAFEPRFTCRCGIR